MQSATSLAIKELADTRKKHKDELNLHTAEVRRLSTEYIGIESALMQGGNALLRSVLHGGSDFEKIKSFIQAKQKRKLEILKGLSLPEDYLEEKFNCENCHDTGFDENGLKCGCLKALISKYVGVNSNLTDVMKNQTFENFDFSVFGTEPIGNSSRNISSADVARLAYNKTYDFAQNFKTAEVQNLLLQGEVGRGKTYLSSCIANEVLKNGNSVYYQTAFKLCEMMENLKFGKYDNAEEREDVSSTIKYANTVDLLIIDDLGTEFPTSFTATVFFDLINTRLINKRSTIISTNLNMKQLEDMYSERVTSRIIGEYNIIPIIGEDLRRRKVN